jgi:nucleoside-diphosphate-sugar epimerase
MVTNLVIGSEGFVGNPFCKYLKVAGEKVIHFDIKRSDKEDARSAKLNLDNIDRVYFLAWDVGGAKYLYRADTQIRQLDWNLKLLTNIMPQLQVSKTPFLFVSSQLAEEYDTVYGVTKRLGEVWTHLLKGVRVRLWNVYGPIEEPSERTHVVSDFVYQAVKTGEIKMQTTGEEQRQFIHIQDVCKALHQALSMELRGVYDVTSFEWITIREVADLIADYTGAKVIPGDIVGSTPITPIRGKVSKWLPSVKLEYGLKMMVDEMRHRLQQEK